MNYATIKENDVANGPGIRVSLFVSGCNHHCEGCFNQETWDFNYGEPFTEKETKRIIDALEPSYIKGFTLLGGEPFEPSNQKGILPLLREIRVKYPDINIWCYTGFDFEKDILGNMINQVPETKEILSYIDTIVDGKFVLAKKDLNLRFKGSRNQRIIMVKESMEQNTIIRWEEDTYDTDQH